MSKPNQRRSPETPLRHGSWVQSAEFRLGQFSPLGTGDLTDDVSVAGDDGASRHISADGHATGARCHGALPNGDGPAAGLVDDETFVPQLGHELLVERAQVLDRGEKAFGVGARDFTAGGLGKFRLEEFLDQPAVEVGGDSSPGFWNSETV